MGLDLTRVPPADLVRLLNSTRLGSVITERRLYRHRMSAGLRIGDKDHIHLLRYASWLAARLALQGSESRMTADKKQQYEDHKARAAKRQADIAEAGQEIGPCPAVVDPGRRDKCRRNFRLFCETYLREWFYLTWSVDHLKAIKHIEEVILEGALFAFAMPRGSGKTALCLAAVLWALVYGHQPYLVLIAATERMARKLLMKVFHQIERNHDLLADYPKVCFPVRKLERSKSRASKQKCEGVYTDMTWTNIEIVLPTVDGSEASGAVVVALGLTGGELRGQIREKPGKLIQVGDNWVRGPGSLMRPGVILLDDPQTKGSAKSVTQTQDRVELLMGDVLGMAGPDKNISAMMPCTVIRPGDMADQILDRETHPEWNGERTKLIIEWPANEELWAEYALVRARGIRSGDGGRAATAFYRSHRAAMDAGARVSWADRFPADCMSAVQHAMNLRLKHGDAMFFAEFQNEPLIDRPEDDMLTADQIAAKVNGRPEGQIPGGCTKLAMFIDAGKKLLHYGVVAFEPNFTAYIVEYGSYPDQRLTYYTARSARRTLMMVNKGAGEEAALYAGLEELTKAKLGRTWTRDDGAAMRIPLCLIDCGWKKTVIEQFCKQTAFAGICQPAKGVPINARTRPLEDGARKGEEIGEGWLVTLAQGKYSLPMVQVDVNYWKTFLHARLAVGIGSPGCLSLWGKAAERHKMIAEHLTSEHPEQTSGRGRKLTEWSPPLPGRDNHLFDVFTGCMAAGHMLGARLMARVTPKTTPKKPRKKSKAKYF